MSELARPALDCMQYLPTVQVDGSGRIASLDAAARALFGARADLVIGQPLESIASALPETAAARTAELGPLLQAVEIARETGTPRTFGLIDVAPLVRTRAECTHLSQLAAAGRLISSIVHEINNPLSGIIGYSQLLMLRELDKDTRAAIEKVYGEALRASRIVRNFLDFSRRRAAPEKRAHLGRVIRKAIELKSHDLKVHNVSVHLDVPEVLPAVAADPHQLLQVFVNLFTNAEQAMYAREHGGRLTIRAATGDDAVLCRVQDTGPGVPPELRERIFEPFFTTKDEGKGTGLGLALCRDLLVQSGGSIRLADSAETGATFELRLRMLDAPQSRIRGPVRMKRSAAIRGRRIVVIEDDPVCRALVGEAFERSGNSVFAFDRGDDALVFLRGRRADLIISDLHRPGLNGIEFHAELQRIDPALAARILFVTGDTLNEELTAFLLGTGNPVLSKPVILRDLYVAAEKLLARTGGRQKTLFPPDPPAAQRVSEP